MIVLAFIELFLRAIDYKPTPPLFIESAHIPGYLQPNEDVIYRYFPRPELAPQVSPDTQYFLKDKPVDSFRILIQGGSTAAGFPYGRWGSLSGMLQQRFKRIYPDKQIEIINTAMASVNSFTLLDFVDEIIAVKPDLVLIYAGHNEYLGVMGVGSAYASRGGYTANLLYLTFKDVKIYRLVESIYYDLFATNPNAQIEKEGGRTRRTLMANIAKEKDIAFDSKLYWQGVEQFTQNMQLILDKYRQNNIPVVLGNLVSNEKDFIPFSAITSPDNQAMKRFQQGQQALDQKRFPKALSLFKQAIDLDTLRFRAPSEFNKIIESFIQGENVYLADVNAKVRNDSPDKLIGNQHMLEHLHPNVRGYFMLSEAFLMSMYKNSLIPKFTRAVETKLDVDKAWQEQPVSKSDSYYANFKIKGLTSDYPFTLTPKAIEIPTDKSLEAQALRWREEGQSWLKINQQLLVEYQKQKDYLEAAKIAGLLADALPKQFQSNFAAGMLYKQVGNWALSEHHLLKAIRLKPQEINARLSLAQIYFSQSELEKSMHLLKEVKSLQPAHPKIDSLINMVNRSQ